MGAAVADYGLKANCGAASVALDPLWRAKFDQKYFCRTQVEQIICEQNGDQVIKMRPVGNNFIMLIGIL